MENSPNDLSPNSLISLLRHVAGLDLSRPETAKDSLDEAFPVQGAFVSTLASLMRSGVQDGSLCNRGGGGVHFSRIFKASEETANLSADAVLMNGPGPEHRHPLGEVDLCLCETGEPSFDGRPAGWVVYPPGSQHVPTVGGGTMLILYLLPQGSIEFL